MASYSLFNVHMQNVRISIQPFKSRNTKTCSPSFSTLQSFITPLKAHKKSRITALSPQCSVSSPLPPNSKEEAILQAKTSLSSTLEKPLNNSKFAGKIKKVKQPRLRVEIPVVDDSRSSLIQLAVDVFGEMPIKRKGSKIKISILWPDQNITRSATKAFESLSANIIVENFDMTSIYQEDTKTLNSADIAVFLTPKSSELAIMKTITDALSPKPVVIFNPKWASEEESDFGELAGFAGSFDVVYSFMGLEVRGILSKRKGMIFKCVRDGVVSGEKWCVFVEENGELKVVSSFKVRPSITEVENVLYNLMAINSPITKSAKFLKDLFSNATGKK